ncbi:putative tsa family protein [Phaeoacremonium minimum UCRPA7]|uniref:Putative tsa family protein n=1 Tax=Phaeoacremonium minimum (strain UCR-PA7) TaxID=1286976 RepID=R8BRS7_PHAM7|nr:putative tsa family protein [Phaeoacremonium minimum UCRPA7]EOO01990.1 putative tsa family protein [Phaeoacremonium minimum UCRPA7]
MAFRACFRPAAVAGRSATRNFHSTRPAFVNVGDEIPNLEVLVEGSPGNKVNLAREFASGNGLIIGVPGAFSGACSQTHVPSYITHPRIQDVGQVFVVAVNDAFVTKAWGEALDPGKTTGFRFLGDPSAEFTKALDLDFDASKIFGGVRSKRYALVIEDGKVKSVNVEKDNTGTNDSMADKVLGATGTTGIDWNA